MNGRRCTTREADPERSGAAVAAEPRFPCHEVGRWITTCRLPAAGDTLWEALVALLSNKPVALPYELIKYD